MSLENVSLVGKEGRVSISKEGVAVCHIFDGELHPPILPTRGNKLPNKYIYIYMIEFWATVSRWLGRMSVDLQGRSGGVPHLRWRTAPTRSSQRESVL